MSEPIEVFKNREQDTQIRVRDWPDVRAPWRVRSVDRRGRELQIEGWLNFEPQTVAGRLTLHVDGREPLTILRHEFEDDLVASLRPEVLGQLVLCARAIATSLRDDLGVGDGCLLWQLESTQIREISRRFPQFEALPRHRRPRPRKRYLIWRA